MSCGGALATRSMGVVVLQSCRKGSAQKVIRVFGDKERSESCRTTMAGSLDMTTGTNHDGGACRTYPFCSKSGSSPSPESPSFVTHKA